MIKWIRTSRLSIKSAPDRVRLPPGGSQSENNYFTEMCSGSEAGLCLRLIDFVYHSTLGLRVITKKRHPHAPDRIRLPPGTRKVDVRLPGKGNSNSHGARPFHLVITMIKWIRTSRLSTLSRINAPWRSIPSWASSRWISEREFFIDNDGPASFP